jgi:hypothetical protein
MRSTMLTFAAGAFLSVATSALASDATVTAQPVSATNPDKIVCHFQSHQGALIGRPVCRTQNEWDRERRDDQRDLQTYQYRSYSTPR